VDSTFKLSCRIDEENSELIVTGGKVYALVDGEQLPGQIGRISPVIDQDKVDFNVYLHQSNHEKLKPNMNLSILVVTNEKDSVLRVQRGPVFNRSGSSIEVFVIESGTAVRRTIETGLVGDGFVEIKSGLSEGERVIISDIASFHRIDEIEIRNNY